MPSMLRHFSVFGDCKIGFHLDLFMFGIKVITWMIKNNAICMCGICFTWLKETRYKGAHSLNSFLCPRKLSENWKQFLQFLTCYLRGVGKVCVRTHAGMCALYLCVFSSHLCFYPSSLSPRISQPRSWIIQFWTLALEEWGRRMEGRKSSRQAIEQLIKWFLIQTLRGHKKLSR